VSTLKTCVAREGDKKWIKEGWVVWEWEEASQTAGGAKHEEDEDTVHLAFDEKKGEPLCLPVWRIQTRKISR